MIHSQIKQIAENIINDDKFSISIDDAIEISGVHDATIYDLIHWANKIRIAFKKNYVFTCAIINAKSGFCSQDCAFCAQSKYSTTGVDIYPLLDTDTIVEDATDKFRAGALNYSIVTSGHSLSKKEINTICKITSKVKQNTNLSICVSLGMLTEATAKKLFESGVSQYHHNLETAESYFKKICTTQDYQENIETINLAQTSGMKICSGGILGMGESWTHRVELAFTLKNLNVNSIPLNFLNPVKGTKMGDRQLMDPMEALKSVALFRFINPDKNITICGGREKTLKDFQSWLFYAGANGLMIGNYLTTKGRNIEKDMEMIKDSGLISE